MALNSWGASNLEILQEWNFTFNTVEIGDPCVTVDIVNNVPSVGIKQWIHSFKVETAKWRWVGMDYDTAMTCANSTRAALTFNKNTWDFGTHLVNGQLAWGYYLGDNPPALMSDVTVEKQGDAELYNVVVNAKHENETYNDNFVSSITAGTPLKSYLNNLDGWRTYQSGWSNGFAQTAAGADNIVLIAAPSRHRSWELAGQDIYPKKDSLGNITFPKWYKCTDSYTCQVKYNGLTLQAVRNLRDQLNTYETNNGWWYSYHPWRYDYDAQTRTCRWM